MVKRSLTQIAYPLGLSARFVAPVAVERASSPPRFATSGCLGHIRAKPSTALLSPQEAKERLREIVEGFFFRRLGTEAGNRVGRLLVKSPPGLGKTKRAMQWAPPIPVGTGFKGEPPQGVPWGHH
jgi:hypothetical protein